jgi:predicted ATP-binding protein involved in virulence
MSLEIQRLKIIGLHHTRDYLIDINDNKIVMVGVNGLGKTTVVNLLYLILSRQWDRALEYAFDSITIRLNGVDYQLEQQKEDGSTPTLSRRLRSLIHRAMPVLSSPLICLINLQLSHKKAEETP